MLFSPIKDFEISELICKHCSFANCTKSRFVQERCKHHGCRCRLAENPPHGKSPEMKEFAVLFDGVVSTSFRIIIGLLGMSEVSVFRLWVSVMMRLVANFSTKPTFKGGIA